jgi:PAS domain S-box-containing protein
MMRATANSKKVLTSRFHEGNKVGRSVVTKPGIDTGKNPEELLSLIHRSPIPMVVTDPRLFDNPAVAANKAFVDLTGYPLEEIIGHNLRFLSANLPTENGRAVLREAITAQRATFVELLNSRRDGTQFLNAVMVAPIFDDEGRLTYFLGSQMEVNEASSSRRRQAAEKVARLTPREREVLQEMCNGYQNKQIAHRLSISLKTVEARRVSLKDKLNAPTSADAIRLCVEAEMCIDGYGNGRNGSETDLIVV